MLSEPSAHYERIRPPRQTRPPQPPPHPAVLAGRPPLPARTPHFGCAFPPIGLHHVAAGRRNQCRRFFCICPLHVARYRLDVAAGGHGISEAMDGGSGGDGQRVVFHRGCGAFGLGDFMDAANALSGQLRVVDVAGGALPADFRPVRHYRAAMGCGRRLGLPFPRAVLALLHHGDAQHSHDAFIGRRHPLDPHDGYGDRLGHRNLTRPVLLQNPPSPPAARPRQ